MLKTILAAITGVLLASGLMVQQASAIPINGDIGFNGSGSGSQSGSSNTLTFGTMTTDPTLHFVDYASVPGGIVTPFANITWTGQGVGAILTSVNSPEWTFTSGGTTYSFNLLALTSATMQGGAVSLQGTGVAFISGAINRDPTNATFSVQGSGAGFTFRIVQSSTSSNGVGVPEGGSAVALLGIGLVGLEVLRRKLLAA